MRLTILLPYKVFREAEAVTRVVVDTTAGSWGFLPQRLDCTAALNAGILVYETEKEGVHYIATSEGILVKTGDRITVSVRKAIGNAPLGELQTMVETVLMQEEEKKREARSVIAKLESGFVRNIQQLRKNT